MAATLLDTRADVSPQGLRPGERLVAGKPLVFNQSVLNLHLAHEAVLSAPLDLSSLTYGELFTLMCRASIVTIAEEGHLPHPLDRDAAKALHRRAANERASRPEYVKAFGGAA